MKKLSAIILALLFILSGTTVYASEEVSWNLLDLDFTSSDDYDLYGLSNAGIVENCLVPQAGAEEVSYEMDDDHTTYLRVPSIEDGMKSTKRVSFIKDTCCDRYLIKKRLELIGDSGIKLFNANEQTYLETLRYGSAGFSGVMANFNPKLFAWIFENYKSNPQKSEEVQEFITAMTFAATLHYPLGVKYILDKYEGIDNCPMSRSLPSETLSDYETMCMEQLWRLDNRFIAALDGK